MSVYVVSDIHGLKDRYDAMMEALSLQKEDHLIVLGDVIDRGKDGIAILRDIMQRENVTMLLGNHEFMMKQYYEAKRGKIQDPDEQQEVIHRWMMNHNAYTIAQFERLSMIEQKAILSYIDNLPLAICDLKINNEVFYLCHGCPQPAFMQGIVSQQDVLRSLVTIEDFVWNRMDVRERIFDDRSVIVGHTPTIFFQRNHPYAIWCDSHDVKTARVFDIDCGCAAQDENSRLGVLCLDQRSVQYF